MSILFGGNKANKMYWGSTPVKKAFWGATKVWPSTVPKYVVVAGYSSGTPNKVYTSTDLVNWTGNSSSLPSLACVAYGNGIFAAGSSSNYYYSTNGTSWTAATIPTSQSEIVIAGSMLFGSGAFITVWPKKYNYSMDRVLRSTDGKTWAVSKTGSSSAPWDSIAYGNNTFAIRCWVEDDYRAMYSTDGGVTWLTPANARWGETRDMAYGNGRFVTASGPSYRLLYSTDASTWSYWGNASELGFYDKIAAGNGIYIATGTSGSSCGYNNSNTFSSWTSKTFATTSRTIYRVKFVNGLFFILRDGGYMSYSSDGINWTEVRVSSESGVVLKDITYGEAEV